MPTQGSALTLEQKQAVVVLKHYFDRTKNDDAEHDLPSVNKVAHALGAGVSTVKRVMADYKRNPNFTPTSVSRGKPQLVVDDGNQGIVRSYVRSSNLEGNHITVENIYKHLVELCGEQNYNIRSLTRALDRWGFTFGKGIRSSNLKEKDYVIAARRRYLRQKLTNRLDKKNHKPEIYLDETYVNKNHSNDFVWYCEEDGPVIRKPTGNGERLIIVNAITEKGWVPNARLVFQSSKKTGDYHSQMNHEVFKTWFEEQLLPNILDNSLIIMDNASYHNALSPSSAPTASCKKEKIRNWLLNNGAPVAENSLKAELVELLSKLSPAPTYAIDEIAQQHGHSVLRTPQYHPELQPIETCWAVVKNTVSNKCDFTMKGLRSQLQKGFDSVTEKTVEKLMKKMRKIEDDFWRDDELLYGDK